MEQTSGTMRPKALLSTMGIAELSTGIALLLAPAWVAGLLLGHPLDSPLAFVIARVAASALIAIGLTCCLEAASRPAKAPDALLIGLLAYNAAVAAVLVHARFVEGLGGVGLWPVAVAHLAFAVWSVRCLMRPTAT